MEESGNYVDQSSVYASQARLANRTASQGRLSRTTSVRTNENRWEQFTSEIAC